jgi:hypothetical protein
MIFNPNYCTKGLTKATKYQVKYCEQGCINPGSQISLATEFCMVAPNISGPSAWKLISYLDL